MRLSTVRDLIENKDIVDKTVKKGKKAQGLYPDSPHAQIPHDTL